MPVEVRYVTDPACSWSWGMEPVVRKLMVQFGDDLRWSWVMGGLARDYSQGYVEHTAAAGIYAWLLEHWLDVAEASRMPIDPRLWSEAPISSTYPACMAVKAAAEQPRPAGTAPEADPTYRYLRAVREGLSCFRRKLDATEALVEEARAAGLDVQRFRSSLASHAIVEAFGADLEEARDPPPEAGAIGQVEHAAGGERVTFPTATFAGADGSVQRVFGYRPYEEYRAAAEAAGARLVADGPPGVTEALGRFGRMATREVELVCELSGPRAAAELWRLATEWRVRPLRVLTGHLWEPA